MRFRGPVANVAGLPPADGLSGMRLDLAILVPVCLVVFAFAWLGYALSLPNVGMIGDRFGYDPGSRFLPLAAGVVLLVALVADLIRNWPASKTAVHMGPIVGSVLALVIYLALFRPLGFVLSTSIVMLCLITLNQRDIGKGPGLVPFLTALVAVTAGSVALFALVRRVVRACFELARTHDLPILREPAIQAAIVGALVLIVLIALALFCRRWRHVPLVTAAQTSIGLTFAVYVVFRQLFLVQLPAGLLNW